MLLSRKICGSFGKSQTSKIPACHWRQKGTRQEPLGGKESAIRRIQVKGEEAGASSAISRSVDREKLSLKNTRLDSANLVRKNGTRGLRAKGEGKRGREGIVLKSRLLLAQDRTRSETRSSSRNSSERELREFPHSPPLWENVEDSSRSLHVKNEVGVISENIGAIREIYANTRNV